MHTGLPFHAAANKPLGREILQGLLVALACFALGACQSATIKSDTSPAVALQLPASFTGVLPCADCEGIDHHLDLWDDGVFHLRRTWLGRDHSETEIGRWRRNANDNSLLLFGGREAPGQWQVIAANTLRMLDRAGQPIVSGLNYNLVARDGLQAMPLTMTMMGDFTYMADAARITLCQTGRSYPVAMAGDYLPLERAYLAQRQQPGAALLARFEGQLLMQEAMEGDALVPTVVVDRFIGLFPRQSCERSMSTATLPNTYWRLISIHGERIETMPNKREANLRLRSEPEPRYTMQTGCNTLAGGYTVNGPDISFQSGITTLMACPPPLQAQENRIKAMLEEAARWTISGETLELFDAGEQRIGLFESVYLN